MVLELLSNKIEKSRQFEDWLKGFDVYIPAPSSIWSRLHGRMDLAFEMAIFLSSRFRKKLSLLPYRSYFFSRKSSFLSKKERPKEEHFNNLKPLAHSSVLLIDDVYTSGATIEKMKSYLSSDCKIGVLTFAKS